MRQALGTATAAKKLAAVIAIAPASVDPGRQ